MTEYQIYRGMTGGIRLAPNKELSTAFPINRDLIPNQLIIPMKQHPGPPAIPTVTVGERVRNGQMVGQSDSIFSAAIHTARAGVVVALEKRPIPSGTDLIESQCILLDVDSDTTEEPTERQYPWPDIHTHRLQPIRDAGIVGLGVAAFPTAIKLDTKTICDTLIINGAECEPYISCDDMLMREHSPEILLGVQAMIDLLNPENCLIAIERDKPQAIEAMQTEISELGDERIKIAAVTIKYPAGGERQLVELLVGKEVPSGLYPIEIGCVCQNVGTAFALGELVREAKPITSRIVTVTGKGVRNPQNVEVPIGTPIRELIQHCGGYTKGATRLILGGSMMGYAVSSDELPLTKATNCVIASTDDEVRTSYQESPCIRCGDCAEVCPVRLLPQELLSPSKNFDFQKLDSLSLRDCIQCGCCDVVCPSQIPLTEYFRNARNAQHRHTLHQQLAETSQLRYTNKQRRLKLQDEQTEKFRNDLKARVAENSDSRQEAIEAAIDRVQRQRSLVNDRD